MDSYLRSTGVIDWQNPYVLLKAQELAKGITDITAIAEKCFNWVRDSIFHIGDHNIQTVACKASEVLHSGSGVCYAKSHLLAALLRANAIPAGLCYQRLSVDDNGPPFCLHGLTAVYLPACGWYRLDPRGDNENVHAVFSPPEERLCYAPRLPGEADLPEIWPDPVPVVVQALKKCRTKDELWQNLPDIPIITPRTGAWPVVPNRCP